jgi:hypothetical protein
VSSRTYDPVADGLGHDTGGEDLTFAAHHLGRDQDSDDANEAADDTFVTMDAPPAPAPVPDLHSFHAGGASEAPLLAAAPPGVPAAPAPSDPGVEPAFHVASEGPVTTATAVAALPWMVRSESAGDSGPDPGATARYDDALTRNVVDTLRRLREEAVDVSWAAASIAVAAADMRRRRRRMG